MSTLPSRNAQRAKDLEFEKAALLRVEVAKLARMIKYYLANFETPHLNLLQIQSVIIRKMLILFNIYNGTQNVPFVLIQFNGGIMTTFIGQEGEYQIHNSRFICQAKVNLEGESLPNRVVHLTTESIENLEDRRSVKLILSEIEWDDITYSMMG